MQYAKICKHMALFKYKNVTLTSLGPYTGDDVILKFADVTVLDPDCGYSQYNDAGAEGGSNKYIVGGWEAREHEFPYQVRGGRERERRGRERERFTTK